MPFTTLFTKISLAYRLSGGRVDKSCVGIFTAVWLEKQRTAYASAVLFDTKRTAEVL